MTPFDWDRLCDLAANGPKPGEEADARRFIEDAETTTAAAKALLNPGAVTPAKARMLRYPVTR